MEPARGPDPQRTEGARNYDIPYDERWARRVGRLLALVPASDAGIVDFGAGECHLRQLCASRPYFPVDITAFAPDVQVLDLDIWARGEAEVAKAPVALCSGSLEYLTELCPFIHRVAREFDLFVFSFNVFVGRYANEREQRENRLWRNHLTTGELVLLCEESGLKIERIEKSKPERDDFEYLFVAVPLRARPAYLAAMSAGG